MKNFKKVLALVLAVATLLSFATIASAATSADYKDAATIEKNGQTEAVDVLSYIGVLAGYPDKNFKADNEITRAEAAKIIAMFDNGSVDISTLYTSANPFVDVKGNWAESYVAYGYKAGIIAGVGKLNFAPNAKLTGVQFLKMVLVVLGYDAKAEGLEGTSWAVNTLYLAKKAGLLAGLGSKFDAAANLLRGQAAQIMLNALKAYKVEYGIVKDKNSTKVGSYQYDTVAGAVVTNKRLASDWDLDWHDLSDAFMRPGHEWTNGTKVIGDYWDTPVLSYTTKASECTMLVDLGIPKTDSSTKVYAQEYLNGLQVAQNATGDRKSTLTSDGELYDYVLYHEKTSAKNAPCELENFTTGQGTLTEVYDMGAVSGHEIYRIVEVETFLGAVTEYAKASSSKSGHTVTGTITINPWLNQDETGAIITGTTTNRYSTDDFDKLYSNSANTTLVTTVTYDTDSFVVDDLVLLTYSNKDHAVESVTLAKTANATLNGFDLTTDPSTTKVDSTMVPDSAKFYFGYFASKTHANEDTQYTFIYDTYGNVIGMQDITTTAAFTVIDGFWHGGDQATGSVYNTADLIAMDATKTAAAAIKSITPNTGAYWMGADSEMFNDKKASKENSILYDRVFTYTMNSSKQYLLKEIPNAILADGSYAANTSLKLKTVDADVFSVTIKANDPNVRVDETNGETTSNTYKTNANTQYLIHENDGTYTAFTGYAAAKTTISAANAELVFGSDNYLKIVYLYGSVKRDGDKNVGYITNTTPWHSEIVDGVAYDFYTAYIGGKATTIYVKHDTNILLNPTAAPDLTGLYDIQYNTVDGFIVSTITPKNTNNIHHIVESFTKDAKDAKTGTVKFADATNNMKIGADTKIYVVDGTDFTAADIDSLKVSAPVAGAATYTYTARYTVNSKDANLIDELFIIVDPATVG